MNEFIGKIWSAQPWYVKLAIVVLLPVALVLCCFAEGRKFLDQFLVSRAQSKTAQEIQKDDQVQATQDQKAAAAQASLDQLNQKLQQVPPPSGDVKSDLDFFNQTPPTGK